MESSVFRVTLEHLFYILCLFCERGRQRGSCRLNTLGRWGVERFSSVAITGIGMDEVDICDRRLLWIIIPGLYPL
jgi:hypothetical protein